MVPSWVASKVGLARGPARTKLPLPKCPCSHRPLAQLAPMPVGLVRSPMGEMPPKPRGVLGYSDIFRFLARPHNLLAQIWLDFEEFRRRRDIAMRQVA